MCLVAHVRETYAKAQASPGFTALFAWRICGGFFQALLGHDASTSERDGSLDDYLSYLVHLKREAWHEARQGDLFPRRNRSANERPEQCTCKCDIAHLRFSASWMPEVMLDDTLVMLS